MSAGTAARCHRPGGPPSSAGASARGRPRTRRRAPPLRPRLRLRGIPRAARRRSPRGRPLVSSERAPTKRGPGRDRVPSAAIHLRACPGCRLARRRPRSRAFVPARDQVTLRVPGLRSDQAPAVLLPPDGYCPALRLWHRSPLLGGGPAPPEPARPGWQRTRCACASSAGTWPAAGRSGAPPAGRHSSGTGPAGPPVSGTTGKPPGPGRPHPAPG